MNEHAHGLADLTLYAHLAALPKIELHRHFEGSLRLSSLAEIARAYQLDVPAYSVEDLRPHVQVMPGAPRSMAHFLSKFAVLRKFYCNADVICRLAREVVEDAAADNVRYLELRFTPKALTHTSRLSFREAIACLCEGVAQAQRTHNIAVRLIVSLNRHESVQEGAQAVYAALDFRAQGIVALDLSGQENGFSAEPFRGLFAEARQAGLFITSHAAEWSGAENVRCAVEKLGATRIGHGVRIVENSSVVAFAREHGITFEVCPTSNIDSGVFRSLAQHPLQDMRACGLRLTLNTDDPLLSNITLTDELYNAMTAFGCTLADLREMALNAAQAAFLPPAERAALAAEIRAAYGD
ncbi:MAG: adenosine deaminase [Aggregatilineales bacterium]